MKEQKLRKIKLFLLDVDGVLTDGSIVYDDQGGEIKVFNVKDGLGIRLLMKTGVQVGVVTGRSSRALRHRCENLGIPFVYDGVGDKAALLDDLIEKTGIGPEEIAFMGDDLPDLPIMRKVGLSIAVADAHELVIEKADMVTRAKGGAGAVREACEDIIKARGKFEDLVRTLF
jgi:3-deoxy-D-manno-octulosonate 8-phosphate phosphatase (KDO 8-P phosphatase)